MSNEPTQKKNPDLDELGVSFNEVDEVEEVEELEKPKKPDAEVYETANKHLSPTEVPGSNEEDIFNVTRAFDEDFVEVGTIVSDKKRKKTSITASLKDAWNEWLGKTKTSLDNSFETIETKIQESKTEYKEE